MKTDRRWRRPAPVIRPPMKQAADFVIWYKISRLKDRYIEKPNGVWSLRRRRLVPRWGKLSPTEMPVNADWKLSIKSRVSFEKDKKQLLNAVDFFIHSTLRLARLCGRHTGGLHHPLSFAIWQRNAAALLIIVKLWNNTFFKCYSNYSMNLWN